MSLEIEEREIEIGGRWGQIKLQSLIGPPNEIASVVAKHIKEGMQPTAIICFGISDDGQNAIVICSKSAKDTASLAALNAIITKTQADNLLVQGFHFASFISILRRGSVVAVFDNSFKPSDQIGIAIQNFIDVIYYQPSGELHNSTSSTILLLSRSGKRVLCVKQNMDIDSPFVQIVTPADHGNQIFGIIDRNIVICAVVGSNLVHAMHEEDIIDLFETGEVPNWSSRTISVSQIEDFSLPVDDGQTVILTAKDVGRRQFIPAVISWDKSGFKITLFKGQCATDLSHRIPAPQRIEPGSGIVVARQNNGGPDRLHITSIDTLEESVPDFSALIDRVSSGGFAAAIAA